MAAAPILSGEMMTTIYTQLPRTRLRDLLLMALTVSSGAIDAISFLALGKVFTAFMTGNIVFLGLLVAGAGGPDLVAVLLAMLAFGAGIYVSACIVESSEVSGLWPARVTVALGLSLLAHAGFLAVWLASDGQPSAGATDVLLGLGALAMGMQSAAVKRLQVEGVYTTAATATVIFLVECFVTWPVTAAARRRLAGVVVALFVGATAGGLLLVHAPLYAPVLPLLITFAVVVTAGVALRNATQRPTGSINESVERGVSGSFRKQEKQS
jgi:uncharacterized membrane protein YoaK (UPF0700 family)